MVSWVVAARVAVDNTYLVKADTEAAEADRKYLVVVAAARAGYLVVVAQASPFVTRLSAFIILGEMRNMRKITTTSDK